MPFAHVLSSSLSLILDRVGFMRSRVVHLILNLSCCMDSSKFE